MTYTLHPPLMSLEPMSMASPCTKFWFFSPVDLSCVSLILRPAKRSLRGRGNFFHPNSTHVSSMKARTVCTPLELSTYWMFSKYLLNEWMNMNNLQDHSYLILFLQHWLITYDTGFPNHAITDLCLCPGK